MKQPEVQFFSDSLTLTVTVTFRGFGQLQVHHLRHLHLQGALRAEQEQQCPVVLHLLRHDAERRKHLTELQDEPESCSASLGRLLLQGIPAAAHQPTRWAHCAHSSSPLFSSLLSPSFPIPFLLFLSFSFPSPTFPARPSLSLPFHFPSLSSFPFFAFLSFRFISLPSLSLPFISFPSSYLPFLSFPFLSIPSLSLPSPFLPSPSLLPFLLSPQQLLIKGNPVLAGQFPPLFRPL